MADGFLRQDAGRGDQVPRPGIERADEHRGRDRAGRPRPSARACSLAEAEKARRAVMNTIEQESTRRPACAATWSRSINGGLYHLYRYKKYTDVRLVFAPEQDDRLLRRRSGQFRVSPLRSRHLLLPRLRERQAGQDRALSAVEPRGRQRGRADLRRRPPRQHRSAEHRGPPGVHPRPGILPLVARTAAPPRGAAEDLQPAERRKRPPGRRTNCSASRTPQGAIGRLGRPARPGGDGPESERPKRRSAQAVAARSASSAAC